jgi:hypothetical protein
MIGEAGFIKDIVESTCHEWLTQGASVVKHLMGDDLEGKGFHHGSKVKVKLSEDPLHSGLRINAQVEPILEVVDYGDFGDAPMCKRFHEALNFTMIKSEHELHSASPEVMRDMIKGEVRKLLDGKTTEFVDGAYKELMGFGRPRRHHPVDPPQSAPQSAERQRTPELAHAQDPGFGAW